MTTKGKLKNQVRYLAQFVARSGESELRDQRNVDMVLSAVLHEPAALKGIQYPVAYVDFLRSCIEPMAHQVDVVKEDSSEADTAANRFQTLLDQLGGELPAVEFSLAREIALVADQSRSRPDARVFRKWTGDVGSHFTASSSFGNKGRILFNVVRFMRSERCVELGTAYGMSALFILGALKSYAKSGYLATVEGMEPQFSLGSSMLKGRYGEAVSCHFGDTEKVIPELVKTLGKIDFLFHDAGHSREDYIRDFALVSGALAPGAVVLFDDIRWYPSARTFEGDPRSYEGWKEVIAHSRVRRAVEVDGLFGLFLVR
jgi:predicted O-methyltransferase YrrM